MSAPPEKNGPNVNHLLIAAGVHVSVILITLALNPYAGFVLLALNSLIGLFIGVLYLTKRRLVDGPETKKTGFADRVGRRLNECRRKEDRYRDEANAIRRSITELEESLSRASTAAPEQVERARNLITSLKAEFDLRHTKALFFADCATRLSQLLQRHHLHQNITAREAELNELRTTNFDDEAAVEEARHYVERDSVQLEKLTELSEDVHDHVNTEQVEALRKRLDTLRGKILTAPQPNQRKKS